MSKNNLRRVLEPPVMSFFLFGPRGTGKSTWIRERFAGALTYDLLDEGLYQALLGEPDRLGRELAALDPDTWVVLDEIQRIPALLNEVHRHIERGLRFVLCGSSARRLRRGGTNLLAGRATRRFMHPFVPEELGAEFALDDIVRWGSLPVIWRSPDRDESLTAHAQMYLREEIQAEALVRNLPGFVRFLPVAALMHGQLVNVSGLARDAGVARTTVDGYLEILEDTLVAYRLPAFEANLRVRERKHPKLYWVDPGLPRALSRQTGVPGPMERGPLVEGLIAGLLRTYRDYRGLFDDWAYWSSQGRTRVEVDFVLTRAGQRVGIEVKSGGALSEASFRGLRAIEPLDGLARRVMVADVPRNQRTQDGIDIWPLSELLAALEQDRLFP